MAESTDNMSDLVYEAVYAASLRIGLGVRVAHDLATSSDYEVRRHRGGQRVYVPAVSRCDRDGRILARLEQGDSAESIAKDEGVCRQTVHRIKANSTQDC